MSVVEPLSQLIGAKVSNLSRQEILFLEAELLVRICTELEDIFRNQYKEYFEFMRFNEKEQKAMIEGSFTRLIVRDILSTEDYTLQGIAYYTNTHEDVVQEIIDGRNTSPSAGFLRKIIDLHRSVRRDLYTEIINKIIT